MGNEKFLINGFDGRKKLAGRISVMGAKNAALKVLASSILFDGDIKITNMPLIQDVFKMKSMLEDLGANVERTAERSFSIKLPAALNTDINEETAKSFRSSIVLIGPILAKEGRVSFPHPGGCVIGERPIDIFLEGFEKMGAKISQKGKKYVISAPRLKSAEIIFRVPSVTATETLMMAAVLTPGLTVLHNVACEPEIASLADFLNSGGAKIRGAGTHTIKVEGVKSLRASGPFETPPDRIEAGSFIILAGLCGKDIEVVDCRPGELKVLLRLLSLIGFNIEESENAVRVRKSSKQGG